MMKLANRIAAATCLALGLAAGMSPPPALGQQSVAQAPTRLDARTVGAAVSVPSAPHGGEFVVPVNKSQLLQLDRQFHEVTIGNSEIADVVPLTNRSVYVMGRKLGSTNMTFTGRNGDVIAVVDLVTTYDLEGLKGKLHELIPQEDVEVHPAGTGVVLRGQVSSGTKLAKALDIAQRYAPEAVTNFLTVGGNQQVMLSVRFAEVQRSVAKELGFNNLFQTTPGAFALSLLSGVGVSAEAFGVAEFLFQRGDVTIDTVLDALEDKGLVTTLAEPNLIVLSGDTADFLAGGEFPIPVAQEGDEGGFTITVEFKEFGVSLAFTPTVLEDGLMNLVMATEVSAIDPSVSVTTTGGISIPGLNVRRTKTTVEVKDGQTFAIAGLLQDDFRDQVQQFPWIGDIPVLGTMFRSSDYQRRQTELVVIITPRLVQPVTPGTLATPLDRVRLPDEEDLFLNGRVEGQPLATLSRTGGGGLEDPYGYIIK